MDDDGTAYLAGSHSILRLDAAATLTAVARPGDRDAPEEPYADQHDPLHFGDGWPRSALDTSAGRLVALDRSLATEDVEVSAFDWTGDFPDGARNLADQIVRTPGPEGHFDLDETDTHYENVAVLISGDIATTVAAHVSAVALEGDRLFVAGQTYEFRDGPYHPSSPVGPQILLVSTEVRQD